jgi:hypothetical protein
MGNKCCGNRNKQNEKTEKDSEDTNKYTSKEAYEAELTFKREKKGKCPYCSSDLVITENLKYIECGFCKEKSMQDGCTTTLYR